MSLNKKVTKEFSIGEALSGLLPQSDPPSPMNLSRRAPPYPRSILTTEDKKMYDLTVGGGCRSRRPAEVQWSNHLGRNRDISAQIRI